MTHWMWFVFPQLAGLGSSPKAQLYGIVSLAEAQAYLAHPVLGHRLEECTELVNRIDGRTAHEIFGSPDDLKFHSSMTLFSQADPRAEVFAPRSTDISSMARTGARWSCWAWKADPRAPDPTLLSRGPDGGWCG